MTTDQELVDLLATVWLGIEALGADLTEPEWKRPTECPGWSVQDNLVHLSTVELMLQGNPLPAAPIADDLAHVKNDIGRANEQAVESRRAWSGGEALEEFRSVTRARVAALRSLDAAGFDARSWTPVGPGTVRDALPFRIFDSWVHGQDMRRAVERPGDLDSGPADYSIAMMLGVMPYVIGKKAGAPDGSTVVLTLTGPLARTVVFGVDGRRARVLDDHTGRSSVTLTTDTETFARLACGRVEPADVAGAVVIEGDAGLGTRILGELNYLF
jgi:uncharacterized protein (TIGR03083 family)